MLRLIHGIIPKKRPDPPVRHLAHFPHIITVNIRIQPLEKILPLILRKIISVDHAVRVDQHPFFQPLMVIRIVGSGIRHEIFARYRVSQLLLLDVHRMDLLPLIAPGFHVNLSFLRGKETVHPVFHGNRSYFISIGIQKVNVVIPAADIEIPLVIHRHLLDVNIVRILKGGL